MKKIILFAMVLSLLTSGVVYAEEEETEGSEEVGYSLEIGSFMESFDWENDVQYPFQISSFGSTWVTRGEDGYYIRLCDILYYADFNMENVYPLCSRPECLHQGATDWAERAKCEAYLGNSGGDTSIQYYKGKIYGLSNWNFGEEEPYKDMQGRLYALSTENMTREELDIPQGVTLIPIMHRGYCYYVYRTNKTDKDGKIKTMTILARKADTFDTEEEILFEKNKINGYSDLRAFQDRVYFKCWEDEKMLYIVYNTKSGEISYITDEKLCLTFEDNHILETTFHENGDQPVIVADVDCNEIGELSDFKIGEKCRVYSDGKYLYVDNQSQKAVYEGEEPWTVECYDRESLEYVTTLELDIDFGSCDRIPVGDSNFTFYNILGDYVDNNRQQQIWVIDKSEIADGNVTPRLLIEGQEYQMGWTWMN